MTKLAVQQAGQRTGERAVFGRAGSIRDALETRGVSHVLYERLEQKTENYDRAASRLELRGERDAAQVLRKAAARLRAISRTRPGGEAGG